MQKRGYFCSILILALLILISVSSVIVAANLQKFTINPNSDKITGTADKDSIKVLFNPTELVVTKATPWKQHNIQGADSPKDAQFTKGEPFRINMDLYLEDEEDVRIPVEKLSALVAIQEPRHAPPNIEFVWGDGLAFKCILEKFKFIGYTMFKPDGTPIQAVVNVTFKEYTTINEQSYNE